MLWRSGALERRLLAAFFVVQNNSAMRNLFFPLCLLALLFTACEEDECSGTVAPQISFVILGEVTVIDQAGLPVRDYPVRVIFQKHWCDGAFGLAAEFTGETNVNGQWSADIQYELSNEQDYITVHYAAGTGETQLGYDDQFGYGIIKSTLGNSIGVAFPARHQFEIIR